MTKITPARGLSLFCALAALVLSSIAPARAGLKSYPFQVVAQKQSAHVALVAKNDGPSIITAHIGVSGENIASNIALPMTLVLSPETSYEVAKIIPVDRTKPSRFDYRVSYQFGNVGAKHAPDARYRLPFADGSTFLVSQAFGSALTTHVGAESEHSVDFTMPEGTPILAAREGIVVDVTMSHRVGGLDPDLKDKANSVSILHEDGTVAQYGHLAPSDAPIGRGRFVTAGTLIGYSGNTGYSQGPHLHFAVTRPQVQSDGTVTHVAVPFTLFVGDPPVDFAPQRGMRVKAVYDRASAMPVVATAAPGRHQERVGAAPAGPARNVPESSWSIWQFTAGIAFFVVTTLGILALLSARSARATQRR